MAIQATSTFQYNSGTYTNPYFRLVLHLPLTGDQTPIDCFMYPSKDAYASGSGYIACLPFYVSNANASLDNEANNVVNKFLMYATNEIITSLEAMSAGSTFNVVEIPTI
jgi:hypothetical protein